MIKKSPESIMKSETCFRVMELIKNVKYVLREVVLKASTMNYPSSEATFVTMMKECKNNSTRHDE